jgi:hypothetical protein
MINRGILEILTITLEYLSQGLITSIEVLIELSIQEWKDMENFINFIYNKKMHSSLNI